MLGAIDWDRRLFDSLIPLPDGTSYNAYLIKGDGKTALVDSVDPAMTEVLLRQLKDVENLDYVICNHAEQDHSGSIPHVLKRYQHAKVICTEKCRDMLVEHLLIAEDAFRTVRDGEVISLGNKTLRFIHTPWVHWPETMVTYLEEDSILFSCDFFGSHIATTEKFSIDEARVYEAAKRYYAEIMMPFRNAIKKNIDKLKGLDIKYIAPSHGTVHNNPSFIIDAYNDWISDSIRNSVVIPYISMHGSTKRMVEHLVNTLDRRGIGVSQFELSVTDIGKLAISLVDAATIVVGTPTVHTGPHPLVVSAVYLANTIRPKTKFASITGSYGWGTKAVEQIAGMIPNLKVELLEPVICKGYPEESDLNLLDKLADTIYEKHRGLGLV